MPRIRTIATRFFPFGREFANHEQARQWAECIEGATTVAVDGSQLLPWRDASIPVALNSGRLLHQSAYAGTALY